MELIRNEKVAVNTVELEFKVSKEVFADAENLSRMGLGIPDITKVFLKLKGLLFFAFNSIFATMKHSFQIKRFFIG